MYDEDPSTLSENRIHGILKYGRESFELTDMQKLAIREAIEIARQEREEAPRIQREREEEAARIRREQHENPARFMPVRTRTIRVVDGVIHNG